MDNNVPKIRRLARTMRKQVGLDASPVRASELAYLHAFVSGALGPGIADLGIVRQVHARQGFSLWKVRNPTGRWIGAYALLYLNAEGLQAVQDQDFDSLEPRMACLAEIPSEVEAIFAWCLVLRGKSKAALIQAASWIELCGWEDCPVFTNPVTERGTDLAHKLGFQRLHNDPESNVHVVY